MTEKPIQTGGNGRTPDGRFAIGNPGGPGNPHTKRLQVWRQALAEAWPVREILDRTLGKAVQPTVNEPDDGERHPVRIVFDGLRTDSGTSAEQVKMTIGREQ